MKRSQQINLSKMRKLPDLSAARLAKVSIVIGGGAVLSGCDSTDAFIYRTVAECELDNPLDLQRCQMAYQNALAQWHRTQPRYVSMQNCEYDFGYNGCEQRARYFYPLMAGFMLGENEQTSDEFDLDFDRPKPLGRSKSANSYNKWVGADGALFGDASKYTTKVSGKSFKPLKGGSRTLGRGGFGKTISSKSSWGG